MNPRNANLRAQEELVARWKYVPEGTPVIVTKDGGEKFPTKTRSIPWLLGGHTAVIMVDGISGAYSLSRIQRVVGAEA